MLYPIWLPMPRPPHFPQDTTLDRLLAGGFDPNIGPFKLSLWRREARDLPRGLFGSKRSGVVPKFSRDLDEYDGVMEFDLPNGWRLRPTYEPPPFRRKAGKVDADFIPPRVRRRLGRPQEGDSLAA